MERVLFTVSRSYNGWRVRDELRNRDWFVELDDALASARALALARHALTGTAAAVAVDLEGTASEAMASKGDPSVFTRN